jgi:hypothetical protein
MPERIVQAVVAAGDTKAIVGTSVTLGSVLVAITEWMPVAGAIITMTVGVFTIFYLYKGIKIRNQEIEMNNQKLKPRHDDD